MAYFDLGRRTLSISTCSPEAQRWFDLRRSGLGQTLPSTPTAPHVRLRLSSGLVEFCNGTVRQRASSASKAREALPIVHLRDEASGQTSQ